MLIASLGSHGSAALDGQLTGLRQAIGVLSSQSETVRHERIDTVIESTTLRCMYELRTEHDFSHLPQQIDIGSASSLLAALISAGLPVRGDG